MSELKDENNNPSLVSFTFVRTRQYLPSVIMFLEWCLFLIVLVLLMKSIPAIVWTANKFNFSMKQFRHFLLYFRRYPRRRRHLHQRYYQVYV